MARATRIALDLALVSLNTVRPVISKVWGATKNIVINTPARPLVSNSVVSKIETTLDKATDMLVTKITFFRDSQLPREQKYLETELEKVKRKMEGTNLEKVKRDSAGKSLKPNLSIVWQYAKVECVPPMTQGFFNGPAGKKLEDAVSGAANNFINGIEGKIKAMDAEEERVKQEKEVAIKAAQDKIKAEEAKKVKDARIKASAEQKSKEKDAAAKKSDDSKKAEAAKAEKPKEKPKKK